MAQRLVDILVIGSGAGGATIAGQLARAGANVLLIDAGPALSAVPGENLRNRVPGERALDLQAAMMRGLRPDPTLGEALTGLPNTKLVHGVGGMLTQWLANCPEPEPSTERPSCIPFDEWLALVAQARNLLRVRSDLATNGVRQARIIERLRPVVSSGPGERDVQAMPVAGVMSDRGLLYHGADVLLNGSGETPPAGLTTLAETTATRLVVRGARVHEVEIVSRSTRERRTIGADVIVAAAGTVANPQLLSASRVDAGPALGRYLTDHPNVESTVRLDPSLVEGSPLDDPLFMVWIPFASSRPWHGMVHRSYPWEPRGRGVSFAAARRSAELRTLCGMLPDPANRLAFDPRHPDEYGLPRVSGRVSLSETDRKALRVCEQAHAELAHALEDRTHRTVWQVKDRMPRGAPHLSGSYRMGAAADGTTVTDPNGRMWGLENLYLAGNGLIPTSASCNPALTVVALAIRTAQAIARR